MSTFDFQIPCRTMTLAAKRWHAGAKYRVLALHGWLDNAASFTRLAPYLDACDIVAIDLPGHGKSGYRQGGGAYHTWQDLHEIMDVLEFLQWERCIFIGHSRGAMIASLFAGCFPQRVTAVCAIDALLPLTSSAERLPEQLAESLIQAKNHDPDFTVYYPTSEQAIKVRTRGKYPVQRSTAELLAERGLQRNTQGYFWAYDSKLLLSSEIRLSHEQAKAFLDRLSFPVLTIIASDGVFKNVNTGWMAQHSNVQMVVVNGAHHLHLEPDTSTLEQLAKIFRDYLSLQGSL